MYIIAAVIVALAAVMGAWVAAQVNRTQRSPEDFSKSIKGFALGAVVWLVFCGYFASTSTSMVISAALVTTVVLIYLPTLLVLYKKGRGRASTEVTPEISQIVDG
jgi:zinc transporter ZupT